MGAPQVGQVLVVAGAVMVEEQAQDELKGSDYVFLRA
jgi:hypothetical protein